MMIHIEYQVLFSLGNTMKKNKMSFATILLSAFSVKLTLDQQKISIFLYVNSEDPRKPMHLCSFSRVFTACQHYKDTLGGFIMLTSSEDPSDLVECKI